MIQASKIRAKQNDITKLRQSLKAVETEYKTLNAAWYSSGRTTGAERMAWLEKETVRLLRRIKDKKQELKILKGEAERERVPAWKGHREEIGLECF